MPTPNLRTDLNIVQLPNTTPNVGGLVGKNTIIVDPDFGASVVRLTDSTSGVGNFQSLQTSDDANHLLWNTDDTMLIVKTAISYIIQFNPSTLQGTQIAGSWQGKLAFSTVSNNIAYQLVNGGGIVNKLTFTQVAGVWTLTSTTQLCNFANILPPGFNVNWAGAFTHSVDDSMFAAAFSTGPQESGFLFCIFSVGQGYRMLNTQTGAITGDWGATGTWILSGSWPFTSFNLHEAYQTPNPGYAVLVPSAKTGGHGYPVWDTNTLTVRYSGNAGHQARGYNSFYDGNPGGGQWQIAPYNNPTATALLLPISGTPAGQTPPQFYIGDQHGSFGALSLSDNSIFWVTPAINKPQWGLPFTSCWQGEVHGYATNGYTPSVTGLVYRACHTFSTGQSTQFIVSNAIGVPSQTGNFVAFCSDWMGTLGGTGGQPQGTLGVNARGDVFVVRIPFGNAAPVITSSNNTTFTNNAAGNFTVSSTGMPIPALSKTGALPAGVTFTDNGDGTASLGGIPTAAGGFSLTITAANIILPNATQPFTLQVNPSVSPSAPVITSAANAIFDSGEFNTFTVTTTGNPTAALSETGALPTGITFVDNLNGTATLSGTPITSAVTSFLITANNGVNPNATQNFTLTVPSIAPVITSANNASVAQNAFISLLITATGSPVPSITMIGTVDGLAFVDNGDGTANLSGVPTGIGTFALQFIASNGIIPTFTQNFQLFVQVIGTNNFGPYYQNTGISYINPWGQPVPGVNSPVNTNVAQTVPNPPSGGINNNVARFNEA